MCVERIVPNLAVRSLDKAAVEHRQTFGVRAEPWGVTRLFYRASDGQVINVGMQTDEVS
jgi:hypothetical protein